MNKIGLCGHFAFDKNLYNGQTIKTRNFLTVMKEKYGKKKVLVLDTFLWKKKPLLKILECIQLAKKIDILLIFPGQNGLKILLPIFVFFKFVYKYKLYYPVIGGWLPTVLDKSPIMYKFLKYIDVIYVETKSMQEILKKKGLSNIEYMPNFSLRKGGNKKYTVEANITRPYRLCTFSRVTKEKGISLAIELVAKINQFKKETVCSLDIFGEIALEYKVEFEELCKTHSDYIHYRGILDGDSVLDTLSDYYLLLFPTFYQGEGFPGTLVEAMMSGLPVVASDWKYNTEIVINKKNGMLFSLDDVDGFFSSVMYLLENPKMVLKMREECLFMSKAFLPDVVLNDLWNEFEK